MDAGIFKFPFWVFAYPWASVVIAYGLFAFALHLHGSARTRFEKRLIWGAPITWSLNAVWAFIASGLWGPIRIDLLLVLPVLMLISLSAVVALVRARRPRSANL